MELSAGNRAGTWRVAAAAVALLMALVVPACSSSSPYLKQGEELEAQGRYEEAIALYQSVIASGEVAPDKVQARLQAATDGLAGLRADKAQAALAQGDVDQAIALAREAVALSASNSRVRQVVKAIVSEEMARASQLQASHRMVEAVAVLDNLLTLVPDDREVREAREALAEAVSQQMEMLMHVQDRKGLPGNALVSALILASVNPDRPELAQMVASRRRALVSRYRVPVVVTVEGRPGLEGLLTGALAGITYQHPFLEPARDGDVRESFQVVLTDFDESLSEVVEEGTAVKSVAVGREWVANPRIEDLERQLAELGARLERLGAEIDRLNAQREAETDVRVVNRIQRRLKALSHEYNAVATRYAELDQEKASLPRRIQTTRYEDVSIPVEVHRRILRLTATYQGRSERPDFPVRVSYTLWGEATDEAQAYDAFPDYGLPAQPPVFGVSEDILRRKAAGDLAEKVAGTTDTVMNDWLVLELRKARRRLKQGDAEGATESFVRVVLGTTGPIPEDVAAFFRQQGLLEPERIRGSEEGAPAG